LAADIIAEERKKLWDNCSNNCFKDADPDIRNSVFKNYSNVLEDEKPKGHNHPGFILRRIHD